MANKQVRISEPVLDHIAKHAKPFETVDDVLRRIFKITKEADGQS